MGTARYWGYVCKLTWGETRREINKAVVRFIIGAIVLLALRHFGAPAIWVDRIVAIGAVAVAAILSFAWKLVVIPAGLGSVVATRHKTNP